MEKREQLPDDSGAIPLRESEDTTKKARALSRIKRELSDEDLNHPGVQKLLIDNLDKAEEQCIELQGFRDKYHSADRDLAVASAEIDKLRDHDLLRSGMLGVGSLMLGYVPNSGSNFGLSAILAVGGLVLVGVSLRTKPGAK